MSGSDPLKIRRGWLAASLQPRHFLRRGVGAAAAAVAFLVAANAAPAFGAADPALATYRGGAVTQSEFEGFQQWKMGAEGYRNLLKDRAELRAALMRQTLLEIVASLAREGGLRDHADYKSLVKQKEDQLLAELWGKHVRGEVVLTDRELDHMIPDLRDELHIFWASFPDEREAARFAAALSSGAAFAAAARSAQIADPMVGETRISAGGETHFSEASVARILALKKGEVSAPLSEPIGWYVVQAVNWSSAEEQRAQQRNDMRREVLKGKQDRERAAALAKLRSGAKIEIDEKALAAGDRGAGVVVAKVNGDEVFFTRRDQQQHGFPQHGGMDKILRKELDQRIDELLAAQKARRLKLAAKDPGFQQRLGYFALEQLGDLYRQRVYSGFTISEEEARDYYTRNQDLFKTPTMIRVRQIVLQSRYLADRYRADLVAGRVEFEELAKRESVDRGSGVIGGDQGWIAEESVREELRSFVEALRPGEISVPVVVSSDYYIIKIESRTEPEVRPYEQVREKVRPRALLAKQSESYLEFVERKQKELEVKLDDKAIDALVAAAR